MSIFCKSIYLLAISLIAAVSAAIPPGAPLESPWSRYDNESSAGNEDTCFLLTFFTHKRGSTIQNAELCLCENESACFSIASEVFSDYKGRYSLQGFQFSAAIEFSRSRYHYSLSLRGFLLFERFIAGSARLSEYSAEGRLLQEIPFVFYGTPPEETSSEKPNKFLPF